MSLERERALQPFSWMISVFSWVIAMAAIWAGAQTGGSTGLGNSPTTPPGSTVAPPPIGTPATGAGGIIDGDGDQRILGGSGNVDLDDDFAPRVGTGTDIDGEFFDDPDTGQQAGTTPGFGTFDGSNRDGSAFGAFPGSSFGTSPGSSFGTSPGSSFGTSPDAGFGPDSGLNGTSPGETAPGGTR